MGKEQRVSKNSSNPVKKVLSVVWISNSNILETELINKIQWTLVVFSVENNTIEHYQVTVNMFTYGKASQQWTCTNIFHPLKRNLTVANYFFHFLIFCIMQSDR